ncbi:acetyl-CoA synthetase-like protein [Ramicandelaber brevisporus]|nr:acetyl-CoA synthetase-like protein [Ramicandelaber brevisporus]
MSAFEEHIKAEKAVNAGSEFKSLDEGIDISDDQSILRAYEVPNSATPGSSPIYRHPFAKDELVTTPHPSFRTPYDAIGFCLEVYADRPFLGQRVFDKATGTFGNQFEWITYKQTWDVVNLIGAGLIDLHHRAFPGEDVKHSHFSVAIYAPNRPEWRLTELASVLYSCPSVALYDTLGPDSVKYILEHSQAPVAVVSFDKISDVLRAVTLSSTNSGTADGQQQSVQLIKDWAASLGILLVDWKELLEIGRTCHNKYPHVQPQPEDVASVVYSSGTSGTPRGCLILHRNIVASAGAAVASNMRPKCELVMLSYLPLAHVYGRAAEILTMLLGGRIGYWCNDHTRLIEDLQILKPTLFASVPRVLNKIYDRILASTVEAPRSRGLICRKAFRDKLANLEAGLGNKHWLWDSLIFWQVRAVLGGRIELITSGSAPIDQKVINGLRVALVCDIVEGYGQTETSSISCFTQKGEFIAGHVGIPAPCNEIKLVDVPDLGYFATDKPHPRGEICIRGGNVFGGYHRDEAATRQALGTEGWLYSGDIGRINEDGTLTIIDRKKALVKLAQGEYVATEAVENVYMLSILVEQMYVHGNSLESQLVGVIVPDEDNFVPWARNIVKDRPAPNCSGVWVYRELCKEVDVRKALMKALDKIAKERKLAGFEQVKAIRIEPELMSIENGLFTPTMKIKRHECAKYYAKQIKEMYEELHAAIPKAAAFEL